MWIAEIWRYPVKSMAGERLQEAEVGSHGIPGDRELVVTDEDGRILDARTRPRLLRHRAAIDDGGGVHIDGRRWDDPVVAEELRLAAGHGARLTPTTDPRRFDILPLLVTSDGALEALGVDVRRLRPNLVIGGVVGLAEREWPGRHLAVGDVVIAFEELRRRCIVTTWDPDTGGQDLDVLRLIHRELGGTFGLNAWAARPGRIRVGDPVTLLETFDGGQAPRFGRYALTPADANGAV